MFLTFKNHKIGLHRIESLLLESSQKAISWQFSGILPQSGNYYHFGIFKNGLFPKNGLRVHFLFNCAINSKNYFIAFLVVLYRTECGSTSKCEANL